MSCWWSAAQTRVCALATAEYKRQRAAALKAGRSPRTFRYSVPDWQVDLVDALGRNDENTVKALLLDHLDTV